jgi:hypothetical protein
MSARPPSYDDRWEAGPGSRGGRRARGLQIGPLVLTPTRVTILLALVGSAAYLAYAVTVRDASQIPMLVSGAAVLGIVFAALAISGLVATWRAGVDGKGGRALVSAIFGGIAALVAAGCLAAAVILALVWQSS